MIRPCPRLVIAALRGGAGKTIISVALAMALEGRGVAVNPFKKGPDYIDAAWLGQASSSPCHNLDTFLMGTDNVVRSFSNNVSEGAIALIEGNRGLYDGVNAAGEFSTAELAKLLCAPVILVVDCDKVTRTTAALVLGCSHLDPAVNIQAVILNRVSGSRHAQVVRQSIEDYCRLPVLGAVPRTKDLRFTERQLGLVPPQEHEGLEVALKRAGTIAEEHLDIDGLLRIAASASPWQADSFSESVLSENAVSEPVTIGVIRDRAFQFYYSENLDALAASGAKIVQISALDEKVLPPVDVLYIGGGFPEAQVKKLAENKDFRLSLKKAAENGLPVYAECGGLMYLGESLLIGDQSYPMVGALPVVFGMETKPQGHGYTTLAVDRENAFFPVGVKLNGHEFHYGRIVSSKNCDDVHSACQVLRGTGMGNKRDGMVRKNILAAFTHLHALGTPEWAKAIVEAGRKYRSAKQNTEIMK